MPFHWYVLHSHPNKEDALWRHLLSKDIEVFYPRQRVQPVNPRARKIKPYFPGYLFVRVDLEAVGLNTFQWMPWVSGLLSFDGIATIVPESVVEGIRQRVGEIAAAGGELFAGLQDGDTVVVHAGPFAGYEAIYDSRLPGEERVRVLLTMLSDRRIPVELPAGQIHKKRATTRNLNQPKRNI